MSSACSLPKVRISSSLPNAFAIHRPQSSTLLNLTSKVYNLLLAPMPQTKVETISCAILGRRGSGKSVMMTSIAKMITDYYGSDSVNIVWSTSLRYNIDHMDPTKPIQVLLVDDAMQEQSSRRIHRNTDVLADYNGIRHLNEDVYSRGRIIVIFAWQRWMDLDPAFRQSIDIVFLKTGQADETEKEHMKRMYGDDCYRYIVKNWSYTFAGDDNAKSRSIVHLVPFEDSGYENGVFVQKMLDFPEMPEFINISKQEPDEKEADAKVSGLPKNKTDPKWNLKLKCYNLAQQSLDCRTIAKKLKISHTSVTRYVKEVEAHLAAESQTQEQEAAA